MVPIRKLCCGSYGYGDIAENEKHQPMLEKLLSLLFAYRPGAVEPDKEEGIVAPVSIREGGRPEDHFLITFNT